MLNVQFSMNVLKLEKGMARKIYDHEERFDEYSCRKMDVVEAYPIPGLGTISPAN